MNKIALLNNAVPESGVGYYAHELQKALQALHEVELINLNTVATLKPWPGKLGIKTINWIRWGRIFKQKHAQKYSLLHAANQTLSFIVSSKQPSVVTIHDIIELLQPQQGLSKYAAQYLYSGIPKASHLICVSEYTKKTVQEQYGIPSQKITVIPNGISADFHPIPDFKNTISYKTLQQELKLADHTKAILYVGSDHPRKNVLTAVRAFSEVKKHIPEAIFIKVGEAGIAAGRELLLQEIDRLHLRENIRLIGLVSQERLNELYNLADIFIYPSLFEGFGLPPLQAMAAGVPVVTSNSTSLPEVVGEAGIMHEPMDVSAFAKSITAVLQDQTVAETLSHKGLERAKLFSWQKAAQKTLEVYSPLLAKEGLGVVL